MCDLTGTGLMAVSTHFDIPFISKRFIITLLPSFLTLEFQVRFSFHEMSLAGLHHMIFYVFFSFILMFVLMFIYRTPEWLKKMFSTITKSERNGPVFRFFMDLGDAGALTLLFVSFF